jgi:hypothetical protein
MICPTVARWTAALACVVVISGCKQVATRSPVNSSPVPPAPVQPYNLGYPPGAEYQIPDPQPPLAPVETLPAPGHSVPDLTPVPPSPPPTPPALNGASNDSGIRSKLTSKSPRSSRSVVQSSVLPSSNKSSGTSGASRALPLTRRAAPAVLPPSPLAEPLPLATPSNTGGSDDALPLISPGSERTTPTEVPAWKFAPNRSTTENAVRLRKPPQVPAADDFTPVRPSSTLPSIPESSPANVPVLLPPGA